MSNQIQPSVTNPPISNLYQEIKQNKLILAPDFQRRFVWTQQHQEQFLDSILQGYPFPEIYVCDSDVDLITITSTKKVIDGQQRLTTIFNYIENLFEKPLETVKPFSELSDVEKTNFIAYKVVVRDVGNISDAQVREIFRRINLTKFKLEDVEIQNAIYDGLFIQAAKDLAESIDLKKYNTFSESNFTRMVDVHFFLSVLSTMELGGYFALDNEIEKSIIKYNEDYPEQANTKSKITRAFETLDKLEIPFDSIWFRKSNFFTLVVELSKAYDLTLNFEDLKRRLLEFENQILENKKQSNNDFNEYYKAMYSGTNSRKARIVRGDLLKKYVF